MSPTARTTRIFGPAHSPGARLLGFLAALLFAASFLLPLIAYADAHMGSTRPAAASPPRPILASAVPASMPVTAQCPCCHGICHCGMMRGMPGMSGCMKACRCSQHPRPGAGIPASGSHPYLAAAGIAPVSQIRLPLCCLSAGHGVASTHAMHPLAPPPKQLS